MELSNRPLRVIDLWKYQECDSNYPIIVAALKGTFKLDPVTSLVWEIMDGYKSIKDICDEIQKIYPDVEKELLRNDILELSERLYVDKLIVYDFDPLNPSTKPINFIME